MKKKIRTIAIVAGGTLDTMFMPDIGSADLVIGVDGGAAWLLSQSLVPHVALGDFDSVTSRQMKGIEQKIPTIIRHRPQKDSTDLELAVEYAIAQRPTTIVIYGGIGTRMDHTWAAIHMLQYIESHNIYAQIVDNFNKINIVRHIASLTPMHHFKYVSLFSLTNTATVTLKGFRYDVIRHTFISGSTRGVSNEIAAKLAKITVHNGTIVVMRSRD